MESFPKIIHQIWLQGINHIPKEYKDNIKQNQQINPDWKYMLWDDIKIINLLRENKEWVNTYYQLEYLHHKVDFARYVILNRFGGAYIDMDARIIKPLNNIITHFKEYELIVSKVNSNMIENYFHCQHSICINNGIIISKPNNIVIRKLIDSIIKNPKCNFLSTKITCIQSITGPAKFTRIIFKNKNNKIKILDSEYLEPCVLDVCNVTDNTHVIHKHAGSWYSSTLRQLVIVYLRYKWLFYICAIIIIYIVIIYNA